MKLFKKGVQKEQRTILKLITIEKEMDGHMPSRLALHALILQLEYELLIMRRSEPGWHIKR